MSMLSEIHQQPDVLRRLLDVNRPKMAALAGLAQGISHVVIAARGTSDNAARYAQYAWGVRNRLAVGLTAPSLFGPLGSPLTLTDALVVGISQSGESPDLVEVLAGAARQGQPTLAITNEPDSPLADEADVVVDLAAGRELAVAATKTYSSELAAVALCALAFAGDDTSPLERQPEQVRAAIDMTRPEAVSGLTEADRCAVVGRGFHLATVFEWALKLQELTHLLAQPYSAADFRHGPVAVVEPGFPMLTVATAGPTYDEMCSLAAEMLDRGAHVITMTDLAETPGDIMVTIPRVEPWLSPIVAAPALQIFAHTLAGARHLDPDAPRHLSKVTRTR